MKRKHIDYTNWSQDELIKELKRIKETTYGLVWHRDVPQEKIDVLINPDARTPEEMFANEVAGKPFPVLKEVRSKEVVSDKKCQTHILIEGDNYHSLAVLNFTHQEAIDVIYIDPPYNTGNKDFKYTDSFKGDYVDKDDPFRHSKWLSFMEKRLKLAQNLLKETGFIFISIDDNEQAPLRLLCDEIFGESNFIANIVRKRRDSQANLSKNISTIHEYLLCYAKSSNAQLKRLKQEIDEAKYTNVDKDKRGPYVTMPCTNKGGSRYEIVTPKGERHLDEWRFKKETYLKLVEDDRIVFPRGGRGKPRYKLFLSEKNESGIIANSWWDDVATNQEATTELKQFFDNEVVFNNPKPVELIKKIVKLSTDENSIILDFMAGSGTTGHAILDLNKEDGGNREFILCTNNENNIATEVCQPRLQKAMKGYKNSNGEKIEGLGGNLKYFTAYDFVESEPSDKNKHKLVNKCTEMLCIKEGIYDPVTETDDYKILKRHDDRYLGIIFYEDAIDEYKKAIKKIDAPINTYVFSLGDDPHTAQFADVSDKVVLQAIPEIILKVYQEIFR